MNKLINLLLRSSALALLFVARPLMAQVGNDNPTGPAGRFNGNVTTGCSYDPYTGNVSHSVTDLTVAGGVGTYPLAFTRTANSRQYTWPSYFGSSGNIPWQHSYAWNIPESAAVDQPINVIFPDGRNITFGTSGSDSYYRGQAGVKERFQPFNATTNLGYLIFPDGGKVEFKRTHADYYVTDDGVPPYWIHDYTYQAQAIIDPFGQRTAFTYNTDGTLQKITEPGGRWIQMTYGTFGSDKVITQITGSDGRSVQYSYTTFSGYTELDHVTYFGDSTLVARYGYCARNVGQYGAPLLWTCDDPMYPGPMRRIACTYRTTNNPDGTLPVYGQIQSENYYDGTNVGAAVSSLSVSGSTRTETRGDGTHPTRTFTYTGYKLTSETDFKGVAASKTYDTNAYISSVTDRRGNTTNFTVNALTGAVITATFPATPGDTPPNTPRGVVTTTYGWASCPDANNRDANNPYYPYSVQDEGSNVTTYYRDTSKRITQINYPDGGSESFTYNSFGQVLTHVLRAGGTESFTYDASGIKQTYRNPSNASGNPTARYSYDAANRRTVVTDALGSAVGDANHSIGYTYNARGQVTVTTLPTDPVDGARHTITNAYNSNGDGTLISVTDQLGHVTLYTYDDYRRSLTVTTPGHNTPGTTNLYYDANGTGNDYTHTDSNVTMMVIPSGKKTQTVYNENLQKITVAYGTTGAATTSYGYDNAGNTTSILAPDEQSGQTNFGKSTISSYDQRNRLMSVTDALGKVTTFTYDAAGRKKTVTRQNGQVTTYDSYDAMNRLLQQTVQQYPSPDAVTIYTYYTSGLLHTMKDPRLVANNSPYSYNYVYDNMGRKTSLTYPPDSTGAQKTELWHYDTVGHNDTFTNRDTKVQTITYDALNRTTNISWNDSGVTPTVTLSYDVASRLLTINNPPNANISRSYFNDNLLSSETETPAGGSARTVSYTYDADGNRATIQYPDSGSFAYGYTERNQLGSVSPSPSGTPIASYAYYVNGTVSSRTLAGTSASSAYTYDALNRVSTISHAFVNIPARTFTYGYDPQTDNRTSAKREDNTGDAFAYDKNDEVTAAKLNILNPDSVGAGNQNISYDANGNRISFAAFDPTDSRFSTTDSYSASNNSLNQYGSRTNLTTQVQTNATYDTKGNLTAFGATQSYQYDAQNRLTSATNGGNTLTFKYDGLNRQVSRTLNSNPPIYSVWDGWNLIEEVQSSSVTAAYLYGATGMIKNLVSGNYYFQDGSSSTSHLSDSGGHLIEWYRYDLQGTPVFYNSSNIRQSTSTYSVRHLFTGQQWYGEVNLLDLRNRFYSPDFGRFLQVDPSGFDGDATNLYRYCRNNAANLWDATGSYAEIQLIENKVYIGIPIFYGGVYAGNFPAFNTAISQFYTGSFKTRYDFYVTAYSQGIQPIPNSNSIYVWPGSGQAVISSTTQADIHADFTEADAASVGAAFMGVMPDKAKGLVANQIMMMVIYGPAGKYMIDGKTDSMGSTYIETQNPDGGTGYFYGDGGYGIYDSAGNGYYIWTSSGAASGAIIGRTTYGDPIYQSYPVDGGLGGDGGWAPYAGLWDGSFLQGGGPGSWLLPPARKKH